jgi:hypothetical protein
MKSIDEWVHSIIGCSGGLHDFENHEGTIDKIDHDEVVACWAIRCLGNADCEGSAEILDAIHSHRIIQKLDKLLFSPSDKKDTK